MGFGAQGLRSITYITHGCWTVLAFLRVEVLVEGVGLGFQGLGKAGLLNLTPLKVLFRVL